MRFPPGNFNCTLHILICIHINLDDFIFMSVLISKDIKKRGGQKHLVSPALSDIGTIIRGFQFNNLPVQLTINSENLSLTIV